MCGAAALDTVAVNRVRERRGVFLSIYLGSAPPSVETADVRPQLDSETVVVDGHFVLDFVRVNCLRADGADLACSLPGPHPRWRGKEDSALKAIKHGAHESTVADTIRAAGDAPPRIQTAVQRKSGPVFYEGVRGSA